MFGKSFDKKEKYLRGISILRFQLCKFLTDENVLSFLAGHYASWTDEVVTNVPVAGEDGEKLYYCHNTPYMFAFVLLIIKWVMLPFIIALCCCCACLTACCACCCKGAAGDSGTVEPVQSVQQSQTSLQEEKKMEA